MNEQLNDNQLKAVTLPLGPTMVIAGPGSGKTHVIVQRVEYMIKKLNCVPSHLLVITFTKAAAVEMQERYIQKYGENRVNFGTFHSIFFRILRMSDKERYNLDNLLSEDKKRHVIEQIYRGLNGEEYEDFIDMFLSHLTLMKNQLIQPKYYNPDGVSKELFLEVYKKFEAFKERHHLFDFDDMLVDCYYLLKNDEHLLKYCREKYRYILIDEFQDINCVQFEIIRLLTETSKNIFIVGDDDQSIYRFRGAKPEFLLGFKEYFSEAQKVILDINYRSTKKILQASNALIAYNENRFEKDMQTYNQVGELPHIITCAHPVEQASLILKKIISLKDENYAFSDIAIIYRTNIQARPILENLLSSSIPFYLRDTLPTLYEHWMTKDIFAYLNLANDLTKVDLAVQIINRPSRYISKNHLASAKALDNNLLFGLLKLGDLSDWQKDPVQELIYHLQTLKNKPFNQAIHYIRKIIGYDKYILEYANYRKIPSEGLIDMLDEIEESSKNYNTLEEWQNTLYNISMSIKQTSKQKERKDAITLTTMHSAKGLEFKVVFIVDVVDGVTPHSKSTVKDQLEEERRLFYVALTRAKEKVYLYVPKTRYDKPTEVSPFIDEMSHRPITVKEGDKLYHQKYGAGIIQSLSGDKAQVIFSKNAIKTIDYKFCIKKKIITMEDKSNEEKEY